MQVTNNPVDIVTGKDREYLRDASPSIVPQGIYDVGWNTDHLMFSVDENRFSAFGQVQPLPGRTSDGAPLKVI